MNLERSCGAIVFTRKNGKILYVIVREKGGAYSFPKGHMEGNETEMETAVREIWEETGLRPRFVGGFRMQDEYDLAEKPGTRKRVTYFLAEYTGKAPDISRPAEIRQILVLPFEEAISLFEHESSRKLFRAANDFLLNAPEEAGQE